MPLAHQELQIMPARCQKPMGAVTVLAMLVGTLLWIWSALPSAAALPMDGPQEQEKSDHQSSIKKLQALGLAMHEYHDATRAFPPAAVLDKESKPLLSWRVLVLPYLGKRALF